MSTDAQPELEEQSASDETGSSFLASRPRLTVMCMVVALVVSVFLVVALYAHIDGKTPDKPVIDDSDDEPNVKPPVDPGNGKDDVPSPGDTEQAEEEKPSVAPSLLAVCKSKLGRVQSRLRQVKSKWDKLNGVAVEWHGDLQKRLAGDDGKRLAADRHLVKRYMAINEQERMSEGDIAEIEQERMSRADIADIEKRLGEFADDLDATEATIKNAKWEVHEELALEELETVESGIHTALNVYEDDLLMVEVLLGQAAALEPGRLSLAEVIQEIEREDKKKRIDRVTEAGELGEEAIIQEMEARAKERERLKNKMKLIDDQRITDELKSDAAKREAEAKHEAKKRKEEEDFASLVQRFEREYPAMKAYLTPFISDGYTQPVGREYRRTTTKGPVSYKSLVGAGVLGEGKGSVERFYYSTVTGKNDRELGAFPPHSFSGKHMERHYETILKVQTFLREFGPVMAQKERHILAP